MYSASTAAFASFATSTGRPSAASQRALEVEARPAEVRGAEDDAAVVDDAGRSDADAEHGRVGVADEVAGELDDRGDHVAVGWRRGTSRRATMSPSSVSTAPMKTSLPGQVDPDDAVAGAVEVDQDRRLAGAGCLAHAHLDDEAVGDQLGDQVGDRDAGQPGLARKSARLIAPWWKRVCSTQRAVVTAGVLGQDLAALAKRAAGAERAAARARVGMRRLECGRAAMRFGCRHVC